jgi:PilZ domain-containing protein
MAERRADLRRYPRAKVTWPVVLEVGDRHFQLQTINLSPMGTKVGLVEAPLEVGSQAKLRIRPPNGRTLDVNAIVWRSDRDGSAFFFIGVDGDDDIYADIAPRPIPQPA